MRNSKLKIGLFLIGGLIASANATSLQEAMEQLTGEAAQKYVAPIVSGIGADLNAGWYHKAPPAKKFRFSLEGGVIVMGSLLDGGTKSFNATQSFRLDSTQASNVIGNKVDTTSGTFAQQQGAKAIRKALVDSLRSQDFRMHLSGPTVIGSMDSTVKVKFDGRTFTNVGNSGQSVTLDTTVIATEATGLLEDFTSYPLPLVAPQVTLGTVYGTNLTLRWLPTMPAGDIGDFSFFGFGVQHNPAVWLGMSLPVDVCVGYFHQELSVGNLFDASTNAYGIDVSKQLGWRLLNITPYAGFQFESATMSFHYDFKQYDQLSGKTTTIPVNFDVDGDNSTRLTVGLSIHVLILNLNADYNLAKYPSMSAGLMVGI